MPFRVYYCPHCGTRYYIMSGESDGQIAYCDNCGKKFTIVSTPEFDNDDEDE